MQLLPTLGMGGSVVFFFTNGQPFMKIMGMVMIASTVAMSIAMVVRFRRGSQGQLADLRRDYLSYLSQTRRTALDTGKAQRDAQYYLHPSPEQLWALVAEGSRVWERRPGTRTSPRCASASVRSRWPPRWSPRDRSGRPAGAADRGRDAAFRGHPRRPGRAADGRLTARLLPRHGQRRSAVRACLCACSGRFAGLAALARGPGDRGRGRACGARTGSGPSGCRTCSSPTRWTARAAAG